MTDYTPHRNLPYPEGSDDVAVHQDVQALAVKTDTELHMLKHEATESAVTAARATALDTATRVAYEAADAASPPRIPVNLVDMNEASLGNLSASGVVSDHHVNSVTPYLPVGPNRPYVLYAATITRVVWFDADQNYIPGFDTGLRPANETHHVTSPENAAYARIGVTSVVGVPYQNVLVIFNQGTILVNPNDPLDYPSTGYWDRRELPPGGVDEAEVSAIVQAELQGQVPPLIPVNLVNMDNASLGNMSSSGTVFDHHVNSVTPFIPVTGGEQYVSYSVTPNRFVWFDSNKIAITGTDTSNRPANETHHWTAPENAAYVRIGVTSLVGVPYQDTLVIFNRGTTPIDPDDPLKQQPSGYWDNRELPPTSGSGSVDEAQVRRIVESFMPQWEPSFPTLQFETIYSGWVEPYWLSEDGQMLYGRQGHILVQSSDEWETRQTVHEFASGRGVNAVRTLANGELLVSLGRHEDSGTKAKLYRSFGYDRDNPTAATWTEVLEAGATQASINNSWGLHVYQNMVVAGEYGLRGVEGARRVWLSEDYGETWELVFDQMLDTQNIEGAPTWTDTAHIHTAAWDPYWSRIWLVVGDNPNTATYYSDDKGATWTMVTGSDGPPPAVQYTGIMPLPDAVLFGSDRSPNGVHVYYRGQKSDMPVIEPLLLIDDNPNITAVFQMPFKRDWSPTTPTYFASTGAAGAGPTVIVGSVDGKKANLLWSGEQPSSGVPYSGNVRWALGPTAQGNIIAQMTGDPTVTGTRVMKAPAPTWARA